MRNTIICLILVLSACETTYEEIGFVLPYQGLDGAPSITDGEIHCGVDDSPYVEVHITPADAQVAISLFDNLAANRQPIQLDGRAVNGDGRITYSDPRIPIIVGEACEPSIRDADYWPVNIIALTASGALTDVNVVLDFVE